MSDLTFDFRPNLERSKRTITFIWIAFATNLAVIISNIFQLQLLFDYQNGVQFTAEQIQANDTRQLVFNVVFLISWILSLIIFIQWFRRAYWNLNALGNTTEYSEGWAAGAWFVPFINWVRPYEIMKELFVKGHQLLPESNASFNYSRYIIWWWVFWLLNSIGSQIEGQLTRYAESVTQFINLTWFALAANLLLIPTTLLLVKLILKYREMELELAKVANEKYIDQE